MFFDDLAGIVRVLTVGTLAYISLIIILRFSGKRTLAKMNAFDFVVTVALGSTLATIILSKDVALIEGVVAFALLALLQFVVAWGAVRSKRLSAMVKGEPALLLYRGAMNESTMKKERVTAEEVRAAIRESGTGAIESVEAVVLETNGSFSIISKQTESLSSVRPDVGALSSD